MDFLPYFLSPDPVVASAQRKAARADVEAYQLRFTRAPREEIMAAEYRADDLHERVDRLIAGGRRAH